MARVSIIIISWNNYSDLKRCLKSITINDHCDYRVIIVDNGSTDGSSKKLDEDFKEFQFIYLSSNKGFAFGNNIGISKALEDQDCEYIFILNNDAYLIKDTLKILLETAEKKEYSNFASFQPLMIWEKDKTLVDSAGIVYSKNGLALNRGAFKKVRYFKDPSEIFGSCAGATLYRAKAVKEIIDKDGAFFDPSYFMYYEDVDVALRLRWRGWKSYCLPTAKVFHKNGETSNKIKSKCVYYSQRNHLFTLIKNIPPKYILMYLTYIIITQLCFIIYYSLLDPKYFPLLLKARFEVIHNYKVLRAKARIIQSGNNWNQIRKFITLRWIPDRIKYRFMLLIGNNENS